MKLIIDFLDETELLQQSQLEKIEELLQYAADVENVSEGSELAVTFVTNDRIQEINREYRDKNQATDVISFAMEEMGEGEIKIVGDNVPIHLGDIIISVQKATEQSEEYSHSFLRELGFLSVHGFLHLLGYDHMNEEDEREMFSLQTKILDDFGLTR